ncbi:MAG: exonuclease SbcCD subunit D C-terminal domain-containing protein [Gammaproteobacteria bacterium]
MLRILHTADWHLGHTLHGLSREYEHTRFLAWLQDMLEDQQADALIIAGDIFDSANPPASAQALFYRFIAEAKARCPRLAIIAIGGNHDSAARLDAPRPLYAAIGAQVLGALPRSANGAIDAERVANPLADRTGRIAAWCAAIPFLRPLDVHREDADGADPQQAIQQVYADAIAAAAARREPGQALIAVGHCHVAGGEPSRLSERRILRGDQEALPAAMFPAVVGYAALGHLHLAQAVGGQAHIRYSGSPIPLSLAERAYRHQVVCVDIDAGAVREIRALAIPRSVEMLCLPEQGPLPLAEVLERLRRLELTAEPNSERQPLLEVRVLLDRPEPGLRPRIDAVLADKPVRLVKISPHYPGSAASLADSLPRIDLRTLGHDDVFRRRYQQVHGGEPAPELLAAFRELTMDAELG